MKRQTLTLASVEFWGQHSSDGCDLIIDARDIRLSNIHRNDGERFTASLKSDAFETGCDSASDVFFVGLMLF